MAMTDPIADMLTRMRNAISARHEKVVCPSSNLKVSVAQVLKDQGYIRDFDVTDDGKQGTLQIQLKYLDERQNAIAGLKKVSKPGRRVYVKHNEIPSVLNGLGINILSTSKGILSDGDARKSKVGGELICSIW